MAKLSNQLPNKTYKITGKGRNQNFQSSIIVALLNVVCTKEQHGSNIETDEKVVNFFRFISTYDKKAAEVMSANLGGTSTHCMKTLNACEQEGYILDSKDNGEKVISRMEAAIACRTKSNDAHISFSLAIDAIKVPPVIKVSSGYNAVIGGEFSKHLIDVEMGSWKSMGSHPDIPLSEVVASWPQSNNKSNAFIKIDGASCESSRAWMYIYNFLSGTSNFSGATDCNHNVESQHHQIIGGGGCIM
eukprot:12444997-Ditylum_brightwellii.AAC.1